MNKFTFAFLLGIFLSIGSFYYPTHAFAGGSDGAACSDNSECNSGVCEGGSCCTAHGAACNSTSHCCGHQSCGEDGKCP